MTNTTLLPMPAPEGTHKDGAIRVFLYADKQPVRAVFLNGQYWFVAADICRVLNLSNPSKSLAALDNDDRAKLKLGYPNLKLGCASETNIINESGLYTLILRSRKAVTAGTPEHKFRKWVTSVVLPSLHRPAREKINPFDAEALREARAVALKWADDVREWAGVSRQALNFPPPGEVPDNVVEGIIADALINSRFLLSWSAGEGRPVIKHLSPRQCVIDPEDEMSLLTLFYEYVPREHMPAIMRLCTYFMDRQIDRTTKRPPTTPPDTLQDFSRRTSKRAR
ncbi:MAG: Bro-N domain-containing protein [Rhodocyclaceae bacterium]|nr:Bro-N domain-containing protein [Rhodocyclaceae bacterium]